MARRLTPTDKEHIFDLIVHDAKELIDKDFQNFITTLSEKEFEETKVRAELFLKQINVAIKELGIKHEL